MSDFSICFNGAARNVTGSCYYVHVNGVRILVDCGFFQERAFRSRNWDPFPFSPAEIDAVFLTHAHLDHCGLLPKLVRDGFRGRIHCTPATADIARIILLDSAHIQEEDAEFKRLRHLREGRKGPYPPGPLYTVDEARKVMPRFELHDIDDPVELDEDVVATFHEAGHILGSACLTLDVRRNGEPRRLLFSGDLGRWGLPILNDPTLFRQADYVVVESTYGNRLHHAPEKVPEELAAVINRTHQAGGNIIIPSFAVERTQELLFHLSNLLVDNRIPHLRVFVDSPMAIKVTEIFKRHPELFDEESRQLLKDGRHPCDFPGLTLCRSVAESKSINHIRGTAIIIAGSGMCTGGRIKHHLVSNIGRPESTILFVGYQAVGTLGRLILEGRKEVRILGQMHRVKARIAKINAFSAHADRNEIQRWLAGLESAPRQVFVTHGEEKAAEEFGGLLRDHFGWSVSVPEYQSCVDLT